MLPLKSTKSQYALNHLCLLFTLKYKTYFLGVEKCKKRCLYEYFIYFIVFTSQQVKLEHMDDALREIAIVKLVKTLFSKLSILTNIRQNPRCIQIMGNCAHLNMTYLTAQRFFCVDSIK